MRTTSTLAFVASLLLAEASLAQAPDLVRDSGPSANRMDIVVLGDGYTAGEMTKLHDDAVALLDVLFTIEPYADHAPFFNATVVYTVSNEAGADHPEALPAPIVRDTAFDAYYECAPGQPDLICANVGEVLTAALAAVPTLDVVLLVVNDDAYGGSGGSLLTVSRNVATYPEIGDLMAHELGHILAGLADEYQTPYPSYPPCSAAVDCYEPNVTLRDTLADIKWLHWIDEPVPLPTPVTSPYLDVVGLFEGARYLDSDIYRPAADCAMRTPGSPFCPVCSEALILSFYDKVTPIDAQSPEPSFAMVVGDERTLEVAAPQRTSGPLSVTWTIGTDEQAASTTTLLVRAADLGVGEHTVTARVYDDTAKVRLDPSGALSATAAWAIEITAAPGEPDGGPDWGPEPDGGPEPTPDEGPSPSDDHDPNSGDTDEPNADESDGCNATARGSPLLVLIALLGARIVTSRASR
ncbi:MAG TPA: M64 family metallopeptidase [Myxococcota bacterium]|nr:M64 family metallopeptidase [Myxococcota bacterium]